MSVLSRRPRAGRGTTHLSTLAHPGAVDRVDRVSELVRNRPDLAVFVVLVSVPLALAGLSFRQPVPVPQPVLELHGAVFRPLVYGPVAIVRTVLVDPLGLDALFSIPGLQQLLVVLTLLGFYYGISVAVVGCVRALYRRYASTGSPQ